MLLMVFGAAKPDWWCAEGLDPNIALATNMSSYKNCHVTVENTTRQCTEFVFADDIRTVVTEVSIKKYSQKNV